MAIAKTAGVRLEWLAAGEGPMRPSDESPAPSAKQPPPTLTPPLDHTLFGQTYAAVRRLYDEMRVRISDEAFGELVLEIYEEIVTTCDAPDEHKGAIKHAIGQLRKKLISGNGRTDSGKRSVSG
ncbi:hypothetical protein CCP2SC5_2550001 [Azospirillaceae bacterium]